MLRARLRLRRILVGVIAFLSFSLLLLHGFILEPYNSGTPFDQENKLEKQDPSSNIQRRDTVLENEKGLQSQLKDDLQDYIYHQHKTGYVKKPNDVVQYGSKNQNESYVIQKDRQGQTEDSKANLRNIKDKYALQVKEQSKYGAKNNIDEQSNEADTKGDETEQKNDSKDNLKDQNDVKIYDHKENENVDEQEDDYDDDDDPDNENVYDDDDIGDENDYSYVNEQDGAQQVEKDNKEVKNVQADSKNNARGKQEGKAEEREEQRDNIGKAEDKPPLVNVEGALSSRKAILAKIKKIKALTSKEVSEDKKSSAMAFNMSSISFTQYEVGHNNKVTKVWPDTNEKEDRILVQMASKTKSSRTIKILVARGFPREESGNKRLIAHQCPVTNCNITGELAEFDTADVILFENSVPNYAIYRRRPANQLWILFLLESPFHTPSLKDVGGMVNFTATYRRDSTFVTPYERWVQNPDIRELPTKPAKNFAHGKTKKVAWFVSNCGARNGRMEYARELSRYIDLDIFGACGQRQCPRIDRTCFDMLKKDYKFYLAFENSNCRDYITEKLYWNAYQNDVLPIVMGARPEDYHKVAPPGSFIHVDSFASPRVLADYLHLLDSNDDLYNQYFRWKDTGQFIDTKWWCRLCAMAHKASVTGYSHVYEDVNEWWNGEQVCIRDKGNRLWDSWRDH